MLPPGTPSIYYHGINGTLQIIAISIFIILGILLMKGRKEYSEFHKKLNTGYGFFLIFFSLCRLAFILAVWFPDEPWSDNSYDFLVMVGYLSATVGLTCIIAVVEQYLIKKTKHVFTILGIILSFLYFLGLLGALDQDVSLLISWISSPVLIGVLVFLYVFVAIKSTADVRKKAWIILIAILLLGISTIIDGESIITSAPTWFNNEVMLLELFYSITPAIFIIASIIFFKYTY